VGLVSLSLPPQDASAVLVRTLKEILRQIPVAPLTAIMKRSQEKEKETSHTLDSHRSTSMRRNLWVSLCQSNPAQTFSQGHSNAHSAGGILLVKNAVCSNWISLALIFCVVKKVFNNVSSSYDVMNDLMSAGIHRLWKDYFIQVLAPGPNTRHLDVAGGTGDIAFRFLDAANNAPMYGARPSPHVTVLDINPSMLEVGKQRAKERGLDQGLNLFFLFPIFYF